MQFTELQFLPNLMRSWYWSAAEIFQGLDDLPKLTVRSLVGIIIAVTGNVLISLALNLQKLAHRRMEEAKNASINYGEDSSLSLNSSSLIYAQVKTAVVMVEMRTSLWLALG